MSTLTVPVTRGDRLVWWRIMLLRNEERNFLMVEMLRDGKPCGDVDTVDEVEYTFFDGLDEKIVGVVASGTEMVGGECYLYLLCDHRPTSDARWEIAGEPVVLPPPPFRPRDEMDESFLFDSDPTRAL